MLSAISFQFSANKQYPNNPKQGILVYMNNGYSLCPMPVPPDTLLWGLGFRKLFA